MFDEFLCPFVVGEREKVWVERISGAVAKVIERAQARYEVQEVEYGRVYRWCPETIVVECDCGKRSIFERSELIASEARCGQCDKKPSSGIREEVVIQLLDEDYEATNFPWRYWHTTKDTGIPY
jgi:hypothetical protein